MKKKIYLLALGAFIFTLSILSCSNGEGSKYVDKATVVPAEDTIHTVMDSAHMSDQK